jgi:hypothetical protein
MRHPRFSVRWFSPLLLAGLALGLSACGGGGGSDDDVDMPEAYGVLGHDDFVTATSNDGGISASSLSQPVGAGAISNDILFVADTANNRVLGYTPVPDGSGQNATLVLGQSGFSSASAGTSSTRMALPVSVAIGNGKLAVVDSGNNRVLIWNSVPSATGTPPDIVLGQSSFTTDTAGLSSSGLSYPTSVSIAGNKLVVADQGNNRVLIWTSMPTRNGQAANLVLGQVDFASRLDGDEAYEMNRPASVWTDGIRVLVADSSNNRVLYWQLFPTQNDQPADFVVGQSDFGRSNSAAGASGLKTPYGVSSDGSYVYVADSGNNRVLRYDSFPLANAASADEVFGQDDFATTTANDDDQDSEVDDTPSARTLNGPTGVSVIDGVLYVADRNNNRVMIFPQ